MPVGAAMSADIPMLRAPDLTGAVLDGRYEVLGKLGVGGMASVYEGRRVGLLNRVAIKVLKLELCEDPANVKRFLREARASSVIEHENVVDIVDFGPTDALPVYFVMEFLEGFDIKQVIKAEGPIAWNRAHSILLQIASALGAAHDKGIVHRDVKPANIFLVRRPNGEEYVKVLDFGIAKVVEEGLGGITRGLTMTNGLLGTVAFMAPEQARGGQIDARTDIYALGVVMYQMMTGQVPFNGTNPFMVLERHVNEAPRPPRQLNTNIPPEAEALILRCLAKSPDHRYSSMGELLEALEQMATQQYPGLPPGYAPGAPAGQRYVPLVTPATAPGGTAPVPRPHGTAPVAPAAAAAPGTAPPSTWAPAPRTSPTQPATPHQTSSLGSGASSSSHLVAAVGGNTVRTGGQPTSSASHPITDTQISSSGVQTEMLGRVLVPKRKPASKSPRIAFFGVGMAVGIAAACALTIFAMQQFGGDDVPAAAIPKDAPVAAPSPAPAPPPEPGTPSVVPTPPPQKPPTPTPTAAVAHAPTPEPVEERPVARTDRRPRRPRRPTPPPTPAVPVPQPTPEPAKTSAAEELHPDLKNPYR